MTGSMHKKADESRRALRGPSRRFVGLFRRRRMATIGLLCGCALLLSGCTPLEKRGFEPKGVTTMTPEITSFWRSTWLWALAVGCLVWGLIFYCSIRYRRRKSDTGLPPQMAYNVPIEILFTVVPVIMVAVYFGKTVQIENKMLNTTSPKNQEIVNVVAQQWTWNFNYINQKVYSDGEQVKLNNNTGAVESKFPILYLPVNKRVEFVLTSRDVIHSFWVIPFLQKMDVIPGKVNKFAVTPTQIGTYQGKCAELCGAYHSQMLFEVKVVSQADFNKHMNQLRKEGQTGFLENSLGRSSLEPDQQQYLPKSIRPSQIKSGA